MFFFALVLQPLRITVNRFSMKVPRKYNSEQVNTVVTVTSRRDRLGNVFFYVEYERKGEIIGLALSDFSSVLDFVRNNLR